MVSYTKKRALTVDFYLFSTNERAHLYSVTETNFYFIIFMY